MPPLEYKPKSPPLFLPVRRETKITFHLILLLFFFKFKFIWFNLLVSINRWAGVQVIPVPFRIGSGGRFAWCRPTARTCPASRCRRFGLSGSCGCGRRRGHGSPSTHCRFSPVNSIFIYLFIYILTNEWINHLKKNEIHLPIGVRTTTIWWPKFRRKRKPRPPTPTDFR